MNTPLLHVVATVLLAGAAGLAAAEELPRSPACRTALEALEQAETTLAASAGAASAQRADAERQRQATARLQPLRLRVANACLGGLTTSPPPSQRTWVAPTVPASPAPAVSPRALQPAVPPVTVPAPRVEPPLMVTHCTAATCVASDGSTLTRVGPGLVGPRGMCTREGVFLRCP
jgi:hypothetical protein